jgi:hypothetical protein
MGMVLWFASMAYGGVRIAAWNDYFPLVIVGESGFVDLWKINCKRTLILYAIYTKILCI